MMLAAILKLPQDQFRNPRIVTAGDSQHFRIQSMTNLPVNAPLDIIATVEAMNHPDPVSTGIGPPDLILYFRNGLINGQTMNIYFYYWFLAHG